MSSMTSIDQHWSEVNRGAACCQSNCKDQREIKNRAKTDRQSPITAHLRDAAILTDNRCASARFCAGESRTGGAVAADRVVHGHQCKVLSGFKWLLSNAKLNQRDQCDRQRQQRESHH